MSPDGTGAAAYEKVSMTPEPAPQGAPTLFGLARHLSLIILMAFIWFVLGMVVLGKPLKPFDSFVLKLTPWERLRSVPPEARLIGRLSYMQMILEDSKSVADAAFAGITASFIGLTFYLTLLYQQKQRRSRENELLMIKNREIARRNEFIRYISATISHEFKNNLGRIKRRLDLLGSLPAEEQGRIASNMEKLFADIEIFKKISDEREAGLVDFEKVGLDAMFSALAAQYVDLADIRVCENSPVLSIFASQTLLKTVFETLLDNSIKYKKPGQARAVIAIRCSEDMDGVRRYFMISFRDEGMGMDEEQADQCFYKGMSSKNGWGQGLYFAKYAIGLHAGKIRIGKEYTAPGVGTEVIINLPCVEEAVDV